MQKNTLYEYIFIIYKRNVNNINAFGKKKKNKDKS